MPSRNDPRIASVGPGLRGGDLVVFESTGWPGLTEEICAPALEPAPAGPPRGRGRPHGGRDFHLGYSPERIDPGGGEHTFERIVKVVAGDDDATLGRVASLYEAIIDAGVHRAPSIAVAEAAKLIENTGGP